MTPREDDMVDPRTADRWLAMPDLAAPPFRALKVISGTNGNDTLNGTSNGDTINGLDGADVIDGREGADQLYGGAGDDTLIGGGGDDLISGGDGTDTVSYAVTFGSISVNLAALGAQEIGIGLGFDTLAGVENLIASPYADTLRGSAAGNRIDAGLGNDTLLMGDGGDDVALGGEGNDLIDFANTFNESDQVNGGAGFDTLVLAGPYRLHLAGANFSGIESIRLGPAFDYKLVVASGALGSGPLTIDGSALGAGDVLNLKAKIPAQAALTVIGGAADDVIQSNHGGTFDLSHGGDDTVILTDRSQCKVLFGAAYTRADQVIGFPGEIILDGHYAEQILLGQNVGNLTQLHVVMGNDYSIKVGSGIVSEYLEIYWVDHNDNIQGTPGNDALNVDASAATARVHVYGGGGDDIMVGGSASDDFYGGSGSNVMEGGMGADRFTEYYGGSGGNYTYIYNSVAESTGLDYDVIQSPHLNADKFDLPVTVTGIDPKVLGPISEGPTFDASLAALANPGALKPHHAMIVDTRLDGYNYYEFLVVDMNGVAGYQSGEDLVIAMNIEGAQISLDNFI